MTEQKTHKPEPDELLIFGSAEPHVHYRERRAAYVVITKDSRVAMVKGGQGIKGRADAFLPGGGSLPDETPEDTVTREVTEELGRSVRLIRKLGEVIQYFYADCDDLHYKMQAAFFAGEFTHDEGAGGAEHELYWLPLTEVEEACFHACHVWAIRQVEVGLFNLLISDPQRY